MASDEDITSDSFDVFEMEVPGALLDYIRNNVADYVKQAKDLSAKIQYVKGQSPKLLLSFGNRAGRASSRNNDDFDNTNTILVQNLPSSANEDLLEVFFESKKKYGGGSVKRVRILADKNVALVEFCETSAVETVLKKKPIMLGTTELTVKPYKPFPISNNFITCGDIKGLPFTKDFTEDLLELHLEHSLPIARYCPEVAAMMTIGTRVVRGKDWKWGEQDSSGEGTVVENNSGHKVGWLRIKWDNGSTHSYRMGADDCFDLKLSPLN